MEARRYSGTPLSTSEARLRQVIDLVPHMIFAKDQKGRFTLVNQATAEAYCTTVHDLIGKTDFDFTPSVEEAEHFRADDLEVLRSGQMKKIEERLTDPEGRARILQTTKIPFTCAEEPSVLGVAVDITSLRRAEEEQRRLEAEVEHVQKLGSLGILAGGLAHDFNNLLTGILANTELLKGLLPASPQALRPLTAIENATERLAGLADQMLAYSGRGDAMVEALDVDQLVHEMVHLLRSSINKKASLVERPAGNLPPIQGNASQLRQVVMNLITNASDALGDSAGEIFLSTGMIDPDQTGAETLPAGLPPGRYVYLNVVDFGCGMNESIQERLFDPFFTTKGEGRGLGMAAVRRILEEHHGALKISSTPGQGSMFTVLLPVDGTSPAAPEPAMAPGPMTTPTPQATTGHETVLVVDDEDLVRDLACLALKNAGYNVLEAQDGREAFDVFRQQAIDAAVLDLSMPRVDGVETFAELRRSQPHARVLFMSGYGDKVARPLLAEHRGVAFIKKPYRVQELVAELQALLGSK